MEVGKKEEGIKLAVPVALRSHEGGGQTEAWRRIQMFGSQPVHPSALRSQAAAWRPSTAGHLRPVGQHFLVVVVRFTEGWIQTKIHT